MQSLDEVQREIMIAHIWAHMSFRQIADAFAISPATAHRQYQMGLAQLRTTMRVSLTSQSQEKE